MCPVKPGQPQYVITPCHPEYVASWMGDQFVRWSPEGDRVLFTQGAVLYAVSEDGAWLKEIARGEATPPPGRRDVIGTMVAFDISPDGKHVAYSTCEYPKGDLGGLRGGLTWKEIVELHHYQIAVAGIDGTRPRQLTNYGGFDNYPAWSPDGERIAYLSGGDPIFGPNRARLMTMAADGSGPGGVVTGFESLALRPPAWSPDGTRLAFAGDDGKSGLSIFTVRATAPTCDGWRRRLACPRGRPTASG